MKKDEFGTITTRTQKAPYGYGLCSACRKANVHLDEQGRLAEHGSIELRGRCPGSHEAPAHVGLRPQPFGSMYTVKFFPNWVRGPQDRETFRLEIAKLTEDFPTLSLAKHAAHQVLIDNNATNKGREWRAEIFKGLRRAAYGSERNLRVTWTKAT